MRIAVDYDNTFSADPRLFLIFIQAAVCFGHEVAIVTSRHPHTPVPDSLVKSGVKIIYCGFKAKRGVWPADVWIDDDPKHIDQDHDLKLLGPMWWPQCTCTYPPEGACEPGPLHHSSCARYCP